MSLIKLTNLEDARIREKRGFNLIGYYEIRRQTHDGIRMLINNIRGLFNSLSGLCNK